MTEQEALTTLNRLLALVTNKEVRAEPGMDLITAKVLDSVDALIFFMELETETGVCVPETVDLVGEGYYKVDKLIALLMEA